MEAYNLVNNAPLVSFVRTYAESLAKDRGISVPPFLVVIAQEMLKKTPFGKILDILDKAAKRG